MLCNCSRSYCAQGHSAFKFSQVYLLGQDRFGDVIGHPQYDAFSHHLYVTVQPQIQQTTPTSTPTTPALPPAQLLTIDPATLQVLVRLTFLRYARLQRSPRVGDRLRPTGGLYRLPGHTLTDVDRSEIYETVGSLVCGPQTGYSAARSRHAQAVCARRVGGFDL